MTDILPKDSVIRNRYKVLRPLGQGGMGAVYLVRDSKEEGAIWAAKEFWHLHEASLFSKEASMLMELSHKGLPRVIDYFTENKKNYLIMERIEGLTIEKIVEKNGPFSPEKVLSWMFQICDILTYLHTRVPPVIFRDLKPSNIMLDIEGNIRLIDFGIARFYEPQKTKDTTPLGTPGYSPPEQYGRGQTSPKSDIYSFGATLYFISTAIDPAEFRFKFPPVKTFNKKFCPLMEKIITKCLEIKPEKRYETATELKLILEDWKESQKKWYENITDWLPKLFSREEIPRHKKQIKSKETRFIDEEKNRIL